MFTAKHFIVDDIACYIGSQNLYICDLAEWGVVIDNPEQVESIKESYWDPMWKTSWIADDCDVHEVMDGLKIDRSAANRLELTKMQVEQMKERIRASEQSPASKFVAQTQDDDGDDDDDDSEAED